MSPKYNDSEIKKSVAPSALFLWNKFLFILKSIRITLQHYMSVNLISKLMIYLHWYSLNP